MGFIKRMDLERGIDGRLWESFELDDKQNMVKMISWYREAEYRGLRSDVALAVYDRSRRPGQPTPIRDGVSPCAFEPVDANVHTLTERALHAHRSRRPTPSAETARRRHRASLLFRATQFPLDSFQVAGFARSRASARLPRKRTTWPRAPRSSDRSAAMTHRTPIALPQASSSLEKRRDTQEHDDAQFTLPPF